MADLLLEVLSEEIPARMQQRGAEDLLELILKSLSDQDVEVSFSEACATPRRLVVTLSGLPERQPDRDEERKGPRVGAPDKAVEGFARSAGVAPGELEQRETGKGPAWFAVICRKGRPTAELLAELLPAAMAALPWPKSMRWGDHEVRWVRPIQSILALFDGAVVPFAFGPVRAGEMTRGHRFLAPEPFAVSGFEDYCARLEAAHVVLDAAERRRLIATGATRLAETEGLLVEDDERLLDEVAGLVEWPVPMIGRFDEAFMAVPPEVLVTEMIQHQRYFPLRTKDGMLAPRFIFVANMEGGEKGRIVTAGNQRVLAARLSDGRHFWDQDRKRTLESRVPALASIVFHDRLGTVADKVARMEALARHLAPSIPGCETDAAVRAAHLAKADLTSEMVGEFPELQGVMGAYYARHDGEPAAVADAIRDHYRPQGPSDACPSAPESIAVALADKLDTLTGFFAIDQKPTGSRDPFALRRAALGVIRLVLENRIRLNLTEFFRFSTHCYNWTSDSYYTSEGKALSGKTLRAWGAGDATAQLFGEDAQIRISSRTAEELLAFFADRLKVHLRDEGVRHDLIDAVFALGGDDDLVRLLARVAAVQAFLATDDGANLLVAYRRAANILRIEEKNDKTSYDGRFDPARLALAEEKEVAAALGRAAAEAEPALAEERYGDAMAALSKLRRPVDAFFDEVTVNTEDADLRVNRLKLLAAIRATLDRVADFSRIEG